MKAWALKANVISASKKPDVMTHWFEDCNVWVPCTIQTGDMWNKNQGELRDGNVWIELIPKGYKHRGYSFNLQLPRLAVKVEHKFCHSWIPLVHLDEFNAIVYKMNNFHC